MARHSTERRLEATRRWLAEVSIKQLLSGLPLATPERVLMRLLRTRDVVKARSSSVHTTVASSGLSTSRSFSARRTARTAPPSSHGAT